VKLNADFKKGFWVGLGVMAAVLVMGLAAGLVRM